MKSGTCRASSPVLSTAGRTPASSTTPASAGDPAIISGALAWGVVVAVPGGMASASQQHVSVSAGVVDSWWPSWEAIWPASAAQCLLPLSKAHSASGAAGRPKSTTAVASVVNDRRRAEGNMRSFPKASNVPALRVARHNGAAGKQTRPRFEVMDFQQPPGRCRMCATSVAYTTTRDFLKCCEISPSR